MAAVDRPVASPSLEIFLTRLADGSPTPGGGAAVALAAATAAALVAMVARVTLKRAEGDRWLADIAVTADRMRERALAGVSADAAAYTDVMRARRTGVPEDLQAALVRATEAPLGMARLAHEVLDLAATLAPRARPTALSDLAVAAALAAAAIDGAAQTVRANLTDITDRAWASVVDHELRRLTTEAEALRRGVFERERR